MGNIKIALVGNPNTGKSTLFNLLTGLNQKVGNFPGITVDKKTGHYKMPAESNYSQAQIIDLPGTYSLYPKSKDESIVFEVLADPNNSSHPDLIVLVADATNLRRNLLLYSQVADLGIPMLLVLNMSDLAKKEGIDINLDKLAERLGVQVIAISARSNSGIDELKKAIANYNPIATQNKTIEVSSLEREAIEQTKKIVNSENDYYALQVLNQYEHLGYLNPTQKQSIAQVVSVQQIDRNTLQANETVARYKHLSKVLDQVIVDTGAKRKFALTDKIDSILTHKVWGLAIFLLILLFIFNAIFSWSSMPMDLIETSFAALTEWGHKTLPAGVLTDLLLDGVVAGLGGVVIFIPQIAILFGLISILEDTGYMARVTFMLDKVMRRFGLSGKSVVPMIGGIACAVPSIMSARNIENWKDRMITIMVTPLVSCSARLPVYTLIISLVIPDQNVWGIFNMQGLTMMAMYLISILAAVLVAWVMKIIIKTKEKSYFVMELPVYRSPRWKNVVLTMYEKSKTFVVEAGKVIIAISIVLWVLASYGPGDRFDQVDQKYETLKTNVQDEEQLADLDRHHSAERLENSYAGILGKSIEPAIRPLGYDWKIGIALITSFAAREAFVGTMSTIYSVEAEDDDISTIREKLAGAKHSDTGLPIFTFATGLSLMLFYAFAMQCMSTVAIVYRETKSWKWPMIQLTYMTLLAYVAALIAYQLLK